LKSFTAIASEPQAIQGLLYASILLLKSDELLYLLNFLFHLKHSQFELVAQL
jgi:hypothetical protein